TLPLSCFPFSSSSCPSRLKKGGEAAPVRRCLSPPIDARSVRIDHRVVRRSPGPAEALSHRSLGHSIAIHEHHAREPAPVQPPTDGYPIQLQVIVVGALVGPEPALLDPCIPEEIRL